MRQFLLGLYFLCFLNVASGQEIPLPENMPQEHPRVLTTPAVSYTHLTLPTILLV